MTGVDGRERFLLLLNGIKAAKHLQLFRV